MSGLLQVLVIEDNPDDAELMARILRQNGLELDWHCVETKADFLSALERGPDVILSDYNLPAWTGIEAFEALREAGQDTPFILVTGALGDEVAVECLKRGMADYVLKENLQRLSLAVQRALDAHQAQLERRRVEEALEALARGTAQVTGEAFFPALVENLARALGMRWALAGRLRSGERETVEMLALWDGDHLADNITYDLGGTPCQDVVRQGLCIHTDGVQAKFPRDTLLREMGAECYMGAPLRAADGGVVGILAVLDDRPYRAPPGVEEIFQVFAARAAAELERLDRVTALEEAAEEWQRTFNTMSDMVTIHDPEFRIVRANRAAARTFGFEPEDMIGKQCYQVFHQRDCPVENCPLHRSLRSGELETLEIWEPTIDKYLLMTTNPIRDAEGKLIGVVHVARDITARKRIEATLRALNAAAVDLQRAGLTEAEIYETATEQLAALGLRGAIILFDEGADTFTFEHFFLTGGLLVAVERLTGVTPAGFRFPRGRVPAYAQIPESGQAVFVADSFAQIVVKLLPDSVSRLAGQLAKMIGPASAILAPLRVEDRVIGVLHVGSDWLTKADVPAITAFADQLSAALENARLYQAALQAAERRNILHWASQEIVRVAEDPEQVYHAVHQAATQLMPCEAFVIALADETRQEVSAVYLVDQGGRWPAQRISTGRGLSGQVIASGEPLLIQDFSPASSEIDAVQFGDPEHVRSILAVPMRLGDRIIGAISSQSYRPHAYTTEDQHLLEMLAAHAAVAVENARLFDETSRRAEETAALLTTAQAITLLDLDAVLETIASQSRALFQADGSRIHLIEPDGETLRCVVALHDRAEAVMAVRLKLGQGFTGRVALNGKPELIPNTLADPQHIQVPGTPVEPEAVALTPLKVGQQTVGVMTVTRLGEERPFAQSDFGMLTAFANQAAVAIDNARLYEQVRRRAAHLEALNAVIAAAIAAPNLSVLLEITLDHTLQALGLDMGAIWVAPAPGDPASHFFVRGLSSELSSQISQDISRAASAVGWDFREPHAVEDWQTAGGRLSALAPLLARGGIRASLTAPIMSEDGRIGGLSVAASDPRSWSAEEITLAEAIGRQLGGAMQRLRLLEEARAHAEMMDRLAAAGEALNRPLDFDEVVAAIGQGLLKLGSPDRAALFLRNPDDTIACPWSHGLSPAYLAQVTTSAREMTGGRLFDSTDPVLIPDVMQLPEDSLLWSLAKAEGYRATGLWPLMYEGRVVAAVGCYHDAPHRWTAAEQEAMGAFTRQAAVALENARLFEETKRRASELEVVAEVSTALRAAGTTAEMVPVFLEKATEVIGGVSGTIFLVEPATGDPSAGSGQALVCSGWYPPDDDLAGLRQPADTGITGHVAATGQIHISEDLARDPLVHILPQEADYVGAVRSSIAMPLRSQERTVGVMHVGLGEQRAFTDQEVRLLTAIAEMAGNALHRATLHEQTTQHLQRLTALRNIDMAISATLDLQVVLNVLLSQVTNQLGVDAADVLLFHPHTQTLEYAAGRGFRSRAIQQTRLRLGVGYAGRAALEQRMVHIADLSALEEEQVARVQCLEGEGFKAYYAVPLIAKGQVKGVLEIYQRAPLQPSTGSGQVPDPQWLEFLEAVAAQAAIAIDNAALIEQLQRSNVELALAYDVTLEGWSRALELRDAETEGHTQRVTEMTLRLARAMGLNGSTLVHIRRGALLHDIGKLGIPDSVLLKPDELTDEEWDIIRLHPVYGHELLSPISYLRPALDIPYCHHERWDGSGYPRGLIGEQIPLPARIFAVVDVYDALRIDRPYRPAWPEERVRQYIREQAGKHFDPRVVEVFMNILED